MPLYLCRNQLKSFVWPVNNYLLKVKHCVGIQSTAFYLNEQPLGKMINFARCILESMFSNVLSKGLKYEVLCTLVAKVCTMMDSSPLAAVSSDVDAPTVLSLASIVTQKSRSTISADQSQRYD